MLLSLLQTCGNVGYWDLKLIWYKHTFLFPLLSFMLLDTIPVFLLHSSLTICGSWKGRVMCAELPLFYSDLTCASLLPLLQQLWPQRSISVHILYITLNYLKLRVVLYLWSLIISKSSALCVIFHGLAVLHFFFTCCQPLIQNLMFTGVFANGKVL